MWLGIDALAKGTSPQKPNEYPLKTAGLEDYLPFWNGTFSGDILLIFRGSLWFFATRWKIMRQVKWDHFLFRIGLNLKKKSLKAPHLENHGF